MRSLFFVASAVSVTMIVAACAPKPAPIMPEPVYDKFGNSIIVDLPTCRLQEDKYEQNSITSRLPVCEDSCGPGEQLNRSISVAALRQNPQCVAIPQDNTGSDTPQRGGKN